MNVLRLWLVLVMGCVVWFGCENAEFDVDQGVAEAVEIDLELASVRSTLASGDVTSEIRLQDSTHIGTVTVPWEKLVGNGRPAAHNRASVFEMLEGCGAIAYLTVLDDAYAAAAVEPALETPSGPVEWVDVSAVTCANCHQALNHIAPL